MSEPTPTTPPAPQVAPQRRNIFLIDRRFQLRFSFFVCSWIFALSLVYPMIIYSLFEYFIRYMAIDPNGPSLLSLQRTKSELLWLLILLQVVFISVTFLISVFMSHKVAGPIYKMRKFLQDSRGGIFNRELVFRKKDHFMELAQDYNHAMKGVSELMIQARSHLDTAVAEIETLAPHAPSGDKARAESTLVALKAARDRIPT